MFPPTEVKIGVHLNVYGLFPTDKNVVAHCFNRIIQKVFSTTDRYIPLKNFQLTDGRKKVQTTILPY
jgi:hypothetical protein